MANTILNAAEYQIEGGLSLKPGNYLAKITDMEIETTENGKRVNFEFVANQGRKKEQIFYEHSNPDTQRIGRNDIKRICDFTGNPTIHLTEDPRTLVPLKTSPSPLRCALASRMEWRILTRWTARPTSGGTSRTMPFHWKNCLTMTMTLMR